LEEKEILLKISNTLKKNKLKIATAESCTGGLIAHTLTNISGSSDYFDRGIISYSNNSKKELLDVPVNTLKKYGAVSKHVAEAMAEGVRKKSKVDIGLSTTGIAGPTGGTKEKPVGLVYIAISSEEKTIIRKYSFNGDRIENKKNTCFEALKLLISFLEQKI